MLFLHFIYLFIWLHCAGCGILVSPPGIKPRPPAVKAPGPNHWTTREFLEEAASREMQTVMENDQVESSGAPQHWEVWETEMQTVMGKWPSGKFRGSPTLRSLRDRDADGDGKMTKWKVQGLPNTEKSGRQRCRRWWENDQVESSGAPQHWEVWETEMTQDDEKGSGKEWLEREKEN